MAIVKSISLDGLKVLALSAKKYIDSKCALLQKSIDEQQNRIDVLADEYCIYKSIENSDGTAIEDSNGDSIIGKTVYSIK